jgi:hypothetical protein
VRKREPECAAGVISGAKSFLGAACPARLHSGRSRGKSVKAVGHLPQFCAEWRRRPIIPRNKPIFHSAVHCSWTKLNRQRKSAR